MMRGASALLAALLLASPLPGLADDLGRLFFTPEQRALLDLARRTQGAATFAQDAAGDGVTLNGIVTRSDGRQTIWLNGRPQPPGVASGRSSSSVAIAVPGGSGQVRLRVGQTLDPTSGKVEEGWRRPQPAARSATAPAANPPQPRPPRAAPPGAKDDGDEQGADSGR